MLTRERGAEKDDPTIIRHLHDLAALEAVATASDAFGPLLLETLVDDIGRGGDAIAAMTPEERLRAMEARLGEDGVYAEEYGRFVGGMAFAGEPEIPSFEEAVDAVSRLCRLLPA